MDDMTGCKRCPNCWSVPTVEIWEGGFWLSCKKETHDHIACGKTLDEAVSHWNHYIAFIQNERGTNVLHY